MHILTYSLTWTTAICSSWSGTSLIPLNYFICVSEFLVCLSPVAEYCIFLSPQYSVKMGVEKLGDFFLNSVSIRKKTYLTSPIFHMKCISLYNPKKAPLVVFGPHPHCSNSPECLPVLEWLGVRDLADRLSVLERLEELLQSSDPSDCQHHEQPVLTLDSVYNSHTSRWPCWIYSGVMNYTVIGEHHSLDGWGGHQWDKNKC